MRAANPGIVEPIPPLLNVDQQLRLAIADLGDENSDFWAFRRGASRAKDYAPFQYPAMMVPEMQRVLIGLIIRLQHGRIGKLLDPFVGSGTVLQEGMTFGLDVTGLDINPLAILLAQTKSGPFREERLRERFTEVLERANFDGSDQMEAEFSGLEKWFAPQAALELSRLRRAIRAEPDLSSRRYMWATLAETVRLCSNSRTSTYKLHVRPRTELENDNRSPLETFGNMALRTLEQVGRLTSQLRNAGQLWDDRYLGAFDVRLQDSSQGIGQPPGTQYDLVVTSPPYGDNTSTVPYGQASYLPLQWIDLEDIGDGNLDQSCLRTTYEIDRRSLGGRASADWPAMVAHLQEISPALRATFQALRDLPADRSQRIGAFSRDLLSSVEQIAAALRPNGYMVWTVGNRVVGGQEFPLHAVLAEFLALSGVELVLELNRKIVGKRMAHRNAIAPTMATERTLIFRKTTA